MGENRQFVIKNLTLMTPDRARELFSGLSAAVKDGDGLVIMGPSGVGKTSLMRAVGGLWDSGSGRIERPPLDEIMFLPQRPCMILGSLRDQLRYPRAGDATEEEQLEALKEVNLADLPMRFGRLDAEMHWVDVLSAGEQQRLAFARLLLNRPVTRSLTRRPARSIRRTSDSCMRRWRACPRPSSVSAIGQASKNFTARCLCSVPPSTPKRHSPASPRRPSDDPRRSTRSRRDRSTQFRVYYASSTPGREFARSTCAGAG